MPVRELVKCPHVSPALPYTKARSAARSGRPVIIILTATARHPAVLSQALIASSGEIVQWTALIHQSYRSCTGRSRCCARTPGRLAGPLACSPGWLLGRLGCAERPYDLGHHRLG